MMISIQDEIINVSEWLSQFFRENEYSKFHTI